MRPPLHQMFIRSARDDAKYKGQPGVHHLLSPDASPAGGAFGAKVRSTHTKAHQGWDLYAPVNTPVYAIADGKIVLCTRRHDLGRHVVLEFFYGSRTLYAAYAHLCHINVSLNQTVREGDVLGLSGTNGNAHGQPPHLHFEIRTIADPPGYSGVNYRLPPGSILGGHYGLH
jgi:murein DD-endopeptidase MepM/ murein hydrolase activator NlpD